MLRLSLCVMFAYLLVINPCFAQKQAALTPEQIIESAIQEYSKNVVSTDALVSKAAIQAFHIDESGLKTLFGEKEAAKIWSDISKPLTDSNYLKAMHENAVKSGPIKSIEYTNLRKDDKDNKHARLFTIIPSEIPVYRAVINYEAKSQKATFVIINNQARFFNGIANYPQPESRSKSP